MKKTALIVVLFSLLFVACSTENEKDLMSQAKEQLQQQEYSEALTTLEKITTEFPETDEAGMAFLELAKLYQGRTIKNVSENKAYLKAVEYYQIVSGKYSQLPEAPGALFMSGFLQANEIHDYDAAKATYQLFLEKYPDNELAESAKSELENIGLTPEQILEKTLSQPK